MDRSMRIRTLFLIAALLLAAFAAAAAPQAQKAPTEVDPSLKALIDKVQAVQEKIQTLRVEFTQTNRFEMLSEPQVFEGTLVFESSLVEHTPKEGQPCFGIPSTRIAETLGRTIVQNIVMLGFFSAATRLVPPEQMRAAVEASVPAGTEELNLKAFDAGFAHFEESYGAGTSPDVEKDQTQQRPTA